MFKRFAKKWGRVAPRCFSVVTAEALTLDVAMDSEEEAQLWTAAVQAMVPRAAGTPCGAFYVHLLRVCSDLVPLTIAATTTLRLRPCCR